MMPLSVRIFHSNARSVDSMLTAKQHVTRQTPLSAPPNKFAVVVFQLDYGDNGYYAATFIVVVNL